MKKTFPIIVAVVLSSVSTLSAAEGFYVFGSVGQSDIDTGVGSVPDINIDETDTMFNIGVGYQGNDYFSVEAGYADLGKASATTTSPITESVLGSTVTVDGTISADVTGLFIGVKGEGNVTEQISLFLRAGFLDWESDASFSGTVIIDGETFTGSDSAEGADGTDPYVALGAAYAFTEQVSVNFQASRYMLDFEGYDVDVDTLSLGATFKF
ncbi:porin family protein [Photobacterium sagamiensis]|uniref:outer membrane beta-barrel protein n=1 Tax=Photobacterium sagamiensis TaxID=2910241 RepID=UPI003D12BCC9